MHPHVSLSLPKDTSHNHTNVKQHDLYLGTLVNNNANPLRIPNWHTSHRKQLNAGKKPSTAPIDLLQTCLSPVPPWGLGPPAGYLGGGEGTNDVGIALGEKKKEK